MSKNTEALVGIMLLLVPAVLSLYGDYRSTVTERDQLQRQSEWDQEKLDRLRKYKTIIPCDGTVEELRRADKLCPDDGCILVVDTFVPSDSHSIKKDDPLIVEGTVFFWKTGDGWGTIDGFELWNGPSQ